MSMPDLPAPGGQPPRRSRPYAGVHRSRVDPTRYVTGLLLWQGVAWLLLTGAGIGLWLATLPAALAPGSTKERVLWAGAELVALAIGACAGAGEVSMACTLRGRPRWLLRQATRLHGLTLASGMILVAVAVMIIGSILELMVLNGAYLVARRSGPATPGRAAGKAVARGTASMRRRSPAGRRRPGLRPAGCQPGWAAGRRPWVCASAAAFLYEV